MGAAACRLLAAAGYQNAGTVEFLVDPTGRFYFLEVNTRLQVEHPVTELVTGIDLVREQLRVAAGEAAGLRPGRRRPRAAGRSSAGSRPRTPPRDSSRRRAASATWRPPAGPWVRVDAGVYEGAEVPLHYDPLMAKLIVVGSRTARTAIGRMTRALDEFGVAGVQTTIPFHRAVMRHPDFLAGRLSTAFVERAFGGERPRSARARPRARRAAAVAAALRARGSRAVAPAAAPRRPSPLGHGWPAGSRSAPAVTALRPASRGRVSSTVRVGDTTFVVEIEDAAGGPSPCGRRRAAGRGRRSAPRNRRAAPSCWTVSRTVVDVERDRGDARRGGGRRGAARSTSRMAARRRGGCRLQPAAGGGQRLLAPMPGKVVAVLVEVGQRGGARARASSSSKR